MPLTPITEHTYWRLQTLDKWFTDTENRGLRILQIRLPKVCRAIWGPHNPSVHQCKFRDVPIKFF